MNNSSQYGWADAFSPWDSIIRKFYPKTLEDTFGLAEFFWDYHSSYRTAIEDSVTYFITTPEINADDPDDKKSYEDMLEEHVEVTDALRLAGIDLKAFGNGFVVFVPPIDRTLYCRACKTTMNIEHADGKYKPMTGNDNTFKGTCPKCSSNTVFDVQDNIAPSDRAKPTLMHWPMQYARIKDNCLGKKQVRLNVYEYEHLADGIRSGDSFYLEKMPMNFIKSVMNRSQVVLEHGDKVYHLCQAPISSKKPFYKGWGQPSYLAAFQPAMMSLLLDGVTETVMVDNAVPFRVITPSDTGGGAGIDPLSSMDAGGFKGTLIEMLEEHRRNPTGFNILPQALQYQTLGGEATTHAPIEVQTHYDSKFYNSIGVPEIFYNANANVAAGPMVQFKVFEQKWSPFVSNMDGLLNWVIKNSGELQRLGPAKASLVAPSSVDDLETADLKLQLSGSNLISKTTALKAVGVNYLSEQRKLLEEDEQVNDIIIKQEERMEKAGIEKEFLSTPSAAESIMMEEQAAAEQAGGGGSMPPPMPTGGAPSGGGDQPETIEAYVQQAEQLAQEILVMDPTSRKSQLIAMKGDDETLHAMVTQKLGDLEQDAAMQGKIQARSQGQPQ